MLTVTHKRDNPSMKLSQQASRNQSAIRPNLVPTTVPPRGLFLNSVMRVDENRRSRAPPRNRRCLQLPLVLVKPAVPIVVVTVTVTEVANRDSRNPLHAAFKVSLAPACRGDRDLPVYASALMPASASALSPSTTRKVWSLKRFLRDLGVTGPPRGAFTLLGPDSIYQISL